VNGVNLEMNFFGLHFFLQKGQGVDVFHFVLQVCILNV
jgi:hypothetical protein